jgi:hypothetical protein
VEHVYSVDNYGNLALAWFPDFFSILILRTLFREIILDLTPSFKPSYQSFLLTNIEDCGEGVMVGPRKRKRLHRPIVREFVMPLDNAMWVLYGLIRN